jgi:hypothetical protein
VTALLVRGDSRLRCGRWRDPSRRSSVQLVAIRAATEHFRWSVSCRFQQPDPRCKKAWFPIADPRAQRRTCSLFGPSAGVAPPPPPLAHQPATPRLRSAAIDFARAGPRFPVINCRRESWCRRPCFMWLGGATCFWVSHWGEWRNDTSGILVRANSGARETLIRKEARGHT